MKKITYLIFSFVLLILINGCAGYEPIFGSKKLQFRIADHSIEGSKILGNKDKNATSKDSSGKILEYKITLNIKVKVTDFVTNDKILNHTFISSLTYDVQNQYSDTVKLENTSIENLIDKTHQELLVKLSQNLIKLY